MNFKDGSLVEWLSPQAVLSLGNLVKDLEANWAGRAGSPHAADYYQI